MKLFPGTQSRGDYLDTQVRRSNDKFQLCKVSIEDAEKYRAILGRARVAAPGPIVCLGTRNGREVDLFRAAWFAGRGTRSLVRLLERRTPSFHSWLPAIEAAGRSDLRALTPRSVIGVEVNPRAARKDVWIGSFDDMPDEWSGQFSVAYSNSFDQSQDPERTAREWTRILKPGGVLVFCFSDGAEPTPSDPVGGIRATDVETLFGGHCLYLHERGSRNGYSEVILRL